MRYGMHVEAGAGMPDIGGPGLVPDDPLPAANWWPVAGTNNSTTSPWPITQFSGRGNVDNWFSPTGWRTVHNLTTGFWNYFRYKNEYLVPYTNPSGGTNYFDQITVDRIVRSNLNQVIPANQPFDDVCSNFGQVLVYPTRMALNPDSTLTGLRGQSSKHKVGYLEQNIPNPASQTTVIPYFLTKDSKGGKLEVFELNTGRIVKSVGIPISGYGQLEFSLHSIPSGIYGYRLLAEGKALDWKR